MVTQTRDPATQIRLKALALIEPSTRRTDEDLIDRDNVKILIDDVFDDSTMMPH